MTDKERYVTKIVAVLVLVIGVSFAYFIAEVHDEKKIDVNVVSDKLDSLTYTVDKNINLSINQFNLANGKENVSDSSVATVSFLANKTSNQAETFYNIYFYIEINPYVYTTEDKKPEIILNVYDNDNNEIKTVDGLDYVSATNSKGTTLNGFDITDKAGLFKVSLNNKITANSSIIPTKQTWKVTLTYINLENNQIANENKALKANIILNDKIYKKLSEVCQNGDNLANCIISYHDSGEAIATNIYHHDGTLENDINDNSYRYAGAANAVHNFVCFGSDADSCPYDNLYRIIGVIDGKVKLIKYDYANSNLLGTDGAYNPSVSSKKSNPSYMGNLTIINKYLWNNATKTNTWSESNLNKVNLNTNFINNIGEKWASKIAETTWKVGGNKNSKMSLSMPLVVYQNEIVNPVVTGTLDGSSEYIDKIGLMYVSDYGFAASPSAWQSSVSSYQSYCNMSWIYMGLWEWTISRNADTSNEVFYVSHLGNVFSVIRNFANVIRPVFNLVPSTTYVRGTGTISDPIIIN